MGLLEGRRALVTGGASGIGLATVKRLTAEGASVAVVDMNEAAAKEAAAEIGGVAIAGDAGDSKDVKRFFDEAASAFGGLDIAYMNAGLTTGQADIAQLTDEQYERIRRVNLDGVVYGIREASRIMEADKGGSIVATASLAGIVAYGQDPIYALTKHGVVGLVRGYGLLVRERGLTLNAICPGIVETPLVGAEAAKMLKDNGFPLLQPEDIAEAVVRAITGGGSGECWVCQPGREPIVYEFKGAPGPRTEGAVGRVPPGVPNVS